MASFEYLLPTRGIVLGSRNMETLAARTEADVIGLARRAEALGYGGVWVGDSVVAKPRLEALSTLAAVGAATESVQLGTAVYLPPLRHAVHVAHQAATVDQTSGGRLALGVGVGIGPDVAAEYANLGVPFDSRGERLNDLLAAVTKLWTGEPVGHDGPHYALEDASIGFGPAGDLPVYVASAAFDPSGGFPSSIRERIVEYGDGWLPISLAPGTYADGLLTIRGMLEDAGRNPAAFDPGYYIDVVIDEDEAAAIQAGREYYDAYYPAWDTLTDDEVRAKGAFGPGAYVAETIEEYVGAGVETMVVRFTTSDQRAQLHEFIDLVS